MLLIGVWVVGVFPIAGSPVGSPLNEASQCSTFESPKSTCFRSNVMAVRKSRV
jgi:hypothetical protein